MIIWHEWFCEKDYFSWTPNLLIMSCPKYLLVVLSPKVLERCILYLLEPLRKIVVKLHAYWMLILKTSHASSSLKTINKTKKIMSLVITGYYKLMQYTHAKFSKLQVVMPCPERILCWSDSLCIWWPRFPFPMLHCNNCISLKWLLLIFSSGASI
jgi:hypothetical protein